MANKESLTDLLDVIGLLLIAAGTAAFVYQYIGWLCLVVAGAIVIVGSAIAAAVNDKAKGREDE